MTPRRPNPRARPVLVGTVVRLLVPKDEREFFLGDLAESGRRVGLRELLGAAALRVSWSRTPRNQAPRGGGGMLRQILLDLRFGFRMMLRNPGYTSVALVTMALGVGANTAMFSIVHGVLLKPLPYPEPDRIVLLQESNLSRGWASFTIAPPNFWDWQQRNRSLEVSAVFQPASAIYTGGDRPETVPVFRASDGFLEILGGEPTLGRAIAHGDLDPTAPPVVILSHGFWQRTFGGDPAILGRTMTLDGMTYTVVGVLPRGWRAISRRPVDLIVPLRPEPSWYTNRNSHFLYGLARLRPGVSVDQARSDLGSIAAALSQEYRDSNEGWGVTVTPLKEVILGPTGSQLVILMAAVGLVLLIACVNLANMALARATVRTRELAIRTAVGAGRGRVVRQLLVESVLLAAVGGAIGVILANVALGAFVTGWPALLPRMREISIDRTVLLFSLGLSVAAGVAFGLAPALSVTGTSLNEALRQGSHGIAGDRSRRWMRATLVAAEVGVAVVLLVGCGLLVRSFAALQAEDPGFQAENRLVLSTPLPRAKYASPDAQRRFGGAALARLRALPGVEAAALTSLIPLEGSDNIWSYWVYGSAAPADHGDGAALVYRVSGEYIQAMGLRLLAGRGIGPEDRVDGPPVVVISESLARRHFAGENPVGRRIRWGRSAEDPGVEIVGVVGDVQHYVLGRTSIPQVYLPFSQRPSGNVNFVIKASVPPSSLMHGVRAAVRAVDPDEPVAGMQNYDALVSGSISLPRFRTLIMSAFGLSALLLAVVGLYGVLAYSVSRRTQEIGVRMALGATRGSVAGLVVREGLPLVGIGLIAGMAGAFALSRILESMLFGVGARDPLVFAAVPFLLTAVALAAMLVPARRAARVDPMRTLGDV